MTKEEIKQIIDAGICAPSADNCQPWRFVVTNNEEIFIYNIPERDNSLYSWGQNTGLITMGALIENMLIKAAAMGYASVVRYFPQSDNANCVAAVRLSKAEEVNPASAALASSIEKRCSNRKLYTPVQFNQQQLNQLTSSNGDLPKVSSQFTIDKMEIKKLASAAAINERILFSNKLLHTFFFNHITWTREEDQKIKTGFYLPTLELPAPAKVGFKIFKHWKLLSLFNLLGVSKFVAKQNAMIYETASLMGAITIADAEPISYIECGRFMQRLWLKVTSMGLSFQLITGIPLLKLQVDYNNSYGLSDSQAMLVAKSYETIVKSFQVSSRRVALLFRVGSGGEPSARTSRAEPEIVWQ